MALPAPVIQSALPGLLELLGIKNGGSNPENLARYVQPTFDLADWYVRARRENNSLTLAFPTGSVATAVPTGVVPSGEWWFVERFTVSAALAAADKVQFMGGRIIVSTGGFFATNTAFTDASVGALAHNLAVSELRPFWLAPGDALNLFTVATIAGASTLQTQFLFSRLKV